MLSMQCTDRFHQPVHADSPVSLRCCLSWDTAQLLVDDLYKGCKHNFHGLLHINVYTNLPHSGNGRLCSSCTGSDQPHGADHGTQLCCTWLMQGLWLRSDTLKTWSRSLAKQRLPIPTCNLTALTCSCWAHNAHSHLHQDVAVMSTG